ncbi:uncharacterized protein LOC144478881 [Augochlora pura]
MTPLPRWVLLALLLAGVGAHPGEHACVRLCLAAKRISGTARGCHEHRRLVLQSSGGRLPSHQQLFSLCLNPCGEPGSPNSRQFDSSVICRDYRQSLIRDYDCHCDRKTKNRRDLEADAENLLQDVDRHSQRRSSILDLLAKGVDDRVLVPADPVDYWRSIVPSKDKMQLAKENGEDHLGIRARLDPKETFNLSQENPDAADSAESPVDWDLWCIAQCDNGRGGSACNCDLIP